MSHHKTKEKRLNGISAAPGICIGKAYLVDREGVDVVAKYYLPQKQIAGEIKRFKAAVKKSKEELRSIIDNTPEELREHAGILETQEVILKDKMLYGRTVETIETESVNAEWALKKVVGNLKSIFQQMQDDYLKERASDIVHVSDRILQYLTGAKWVDIKEIDKRVVLVARDLSPAQTSQINLERIKGFVTDRGGKASHTGIIARSIEIPAVLGLDRATIDIRHDDLIIVDGTAGVVIIHPTEKTLVNYEERRYRYEQRRAQISRSSRLPAETKDGSKMTIMGNIELPEEIVSVLNYGGEGVGLYRTEFQYMNRSSFPGEQELFERYQDVVEVMAPKPVTIRTLDINGDKAVSNRFQCHETNPDLGLRGIRYCLKRPQVFQTQLRAILRAAAFGNIRIMFPMISHYKEIIDAKKMLEQAAESLEKEGIPYNRDIQVGIMLEVPSAAVMADLMAEEVDFFSVGTNDLIQYTLAVDRGNEQVADLFRPLDPAVIRLLKQMTEVSKAKNTPIFMCGEMAGDPINIPLLMAMGFDELSMSPQGIPAVKRMVRAIRLKETPDLLAEVLKQKNAKHIAQLLKSAYGQVLKEINLLENNQDNDGN